MKRFIVPMAASIAWALTLTPLGISTAFACTAADFGAVVDQTAQALRDLNINGAKRFQAKLQTLRQKHGLTEDEIQTRAASLQDEKMSEFNREIDTLVNQMDVLSQTANDKITCEKLDELKRVRDRLLTIMGQKSGYMLARADGELDRPSGGPGVTAAPMQRSDEPASSARTAPKGDRLDQKRETADKGVATPPPGAARKDALPQSPPVSAADVPPAAIKPALPERRTEPTRTARNWAPDNQSQSQTFAPTPPGLAKPDYRPPNDSDAPPTVLAPPQDGQLQLPPPDGNLSLPSGGSQSLENTYSIAEIQEAGRGIFGTVTAQFGGAINYAFQNFGQPNAYITGGEGGAAILAGLRYGKGRLHVKAAPESDIYWQGPSVGYDLGAEGSNALFLVYNLDDPSRIYGRFSGVGGAAYVAGGIGLNVLGKGDMVMVPIRSGVGLRLGANLAYLKFTERQTWNPF